MPSFASINGPVRKHIVFAYIAAFDMQSVAGYIIAFLHQRFHPYDPFPLSRYTVLLRSTSLAY
jgi:hypothetical protein